MTKLHLILTATAGELDFDTCRYIYRYKTYADTERHLKYFIKQCHIHCQLGTFTPHQTKTLFQSTCRHSCRGVFDPGKYTKGLFFSVPHCPRFQEKKQTGIHSEG